MADGMFPIYSLRICLHLPDRLQLLKVPRLEMVQTVDSIKLADVLDKKWPVPAAGGPLKILIQVNTSSEDGAYRPLSMSKFLREL